MSTSVSLVLSSAATNGGTKFLAQIDGGALSGDNTNTSHELVTADRRHQFGDPSGLRELVLNS